MGALCRNQQYELRNKKTTKDNHEAFIIKLHDRMRSPGTAAVTDPHRGGRQDLELVLLIPDKRRGEEAVARRKEHSVREGRMEAPAVPAGDVGRPA